MGYTRRLKTSLFFGIILTLFLFSCNEKNEKAVLLLSPLDLYIPALSSQVVVIEITCTSPFELKQFTIKSRVEGQYSITELDTSITGKTFFLQYEYLVPELGEISTITLVFDVFDATNEKVSNFKVIEVTPSYTVLTETAGHELYSGNSGKQNGYNLISGLPNYLHLADSSNVNIADTTDSETLQKLWISPAGNKFVRFNGFDYANCTTLSSKAAYDAGLRLEFLNNITEGDIFITKIRTRDLKEIYPVIKITAVIDQPGSESDRYIFNIKK